MMLFGLFGAFMAGTVQHLLLCSRGEKKQHRGLKKTWGLLYCMTHMCNTTIFFMKKVWKKKKKHLPAWLSSDLRGIKGWMFFLLSGSTVQILHACSVKTSLSSKPFVFLLPADFLCLMTKIIFCILALIKASVFFTSSTVTLTQS